MINIIIYASRPIFNDKIRQKAQSYSYLINEICPHQCVIIDM